MTHLQYDETRRRIRELSAVGGEQRRVDWLSSSLGVARGAQSRVEIFLPGAALDTRLPAVSAAITHGSWSRRGGNSPFDAVRLLLPSGPQYDEIAATVCVELERANLEIARQAAFTKCESLIEIALSQAALASEAVLGLFGELYLMHFWLQATVADVDTVLQGWHGFYPSYRDFVVGSLGVEVKSTLGPNSSHTVSGVHQVEPTPSDQRPGEEQLLLVSLGLSPLLTGLSTLDLIRDTENLLLARNSESAAEFLTHVSDYGGGLTGYRLGNENQPALLRQRYGVTFVRGYDMSDPALQVLRLSDLQARPHVQPDSLTFRINLPAQLSGDLNPVTGIANVVDRLQGAGMAAP